MSQVLKYTGIGLIIFYTITGVLMKHMEFIPDNAKIHIVEEHQIWIPNAQWSNEDYKLVDPFFVESIYFEVKKGKYKGFQLPKKWQNEEGKARIYWGVNESLLMHWILPEKNRWDKEGNWSY